MVVSGSWCEEKLRAWVGMKDGNGWVGGSLTGWKVGAKRLQDEDGNGRLPDCRARICTAGCCFVSIMQITCTCCAVLPWVCCFGRGWLAAPQAAAAAPVTVGSTRPRAQEGKWNGFGQLFGETPQLVHTGVFPLSLLCCFTPAKSLTHQILCWGKCFVLLSLVKLSAELPVIPCPTRSFRSISPGSTSLLFWTFSELGGTWGRGIRQVGSSGGSTFHIGPVHISIAQPCPNLQCFKSCAQRSLPLCREHKWLSEKFDSFCSQVMQRSQTAKFRSAFCLMPGQGIQSRALICLRS